MLKKLRNSIIDFASSQKYYPIITGLATGLYPLLYFYNANFSLLNSWSQFLFFSFLYVIAPILVFLIIDITKIRHKITSLSKYLVSILGLVIFSFLIVFSTYGIGEKKIALMVVLGAFALGIILFKHYNKIIVFQLILALMTAPKLIPDLSKQLFYSHDWMKQHDAVEKAVFKKKPNIYLIQPDGYVNFSELKRGFYNFDNSEFEDFLNSSGFVNYPNFRSNYYSTLSSNTSMFAMKHHFYNDPKPNEGELFNSREIIVGRNPAISTFKNNGYKTNLILEHTYLLVNRPKIYYDYCNIDYKDVSFFARGFEFKRDVIKDLEAQIEKNTQGSNFYFIEKISPGHITSYGNKSDGVEIERANYLKRLEEANIFLKDIITLITEKDDNPLIILASDHGGYVGFNYTVESRSKVTDPNLIKSIFSSNLSIKWPQDNNDYFEEELKTNVNLFRVLFSYLSDDKIFLDQMEEDKSFMQIYYGAPFGVYEYINEDGDATFNRVEVH